MRKQSFRLPRRRSDLGMALVICLALLVLITAVVMAFFARATANRAVESSRMHRVKTELLTQSASDYVVGLFLQEISDPANSTSTVIGTNTIYYPRTAANAAPRRALAGAVIATDTNFFNLIRQSVPGVDTNATTISSALAAKNGRTVKLRRWNSPMLLSGGGFTTDAQLPHWIYVNPEGSVTNNPSTNVIGRFAYNVYNEGGLLDANVAGYPSLVTGSDLAAIKGTIAGADLTQLGITQASIDALVAFRNPSAATAAAYTNIVGHAARDRFNFRRSTNYDNNTFTTRQDLLRYVQSENPGLTNALPYLSTSVKTHTSPSYRPDPARPKVGSLDDRFNPAILEMRVVREFDRMDGSRAKVGEPLIKRRFPLSRLAWLTKDGPAVGITADQIEKAFGLVFESGRWRYTQGGTGVILTLQEVRDLATAREPNFFELLQAGMLYGSLGKTGGGNSITLAADRSIPRQIFQVAANLIDQADQDGIPTVLRLGTNDFYGVENLPYLNRVFMTPYRMHGASQPTTQENAGIWFQPEIWNPHANTLPLPPDTPTNFRFVATGQVAVGFGHMSSDLIAYPEGYLMGPVVTFADPASNSSAGISFSTASVNFDQPTPLSPGNANALGGDHVTDDGLVDFLGLYAGMANAPDFRHTNDPEDSFYKYATVFFQTPVTFLLQYQRDGQWHTYNEVSQVDVMAYDGERPSGGMYRTLLPASFYSLIDPRTDRFGTTVGFVEMSPGNPSFGPNFGSGLTQRSTASIGAQRHGGVNAWAGWTFGGPDVVGALQGYFGVLSDNLPSSVTRYTDPDGVLRPADGAYTTGSLPEGYPLATGNFESRPVVLNRPFRSVAEMGYASRDIPWKHIDFFSKDSADAGLLDLFCVSESTPLIETTPNPLLEAGRVDLNTRQTSVLRAILTGVGKSETGDILSSADATTLADLLVARTMDTSRGPLINVSDLVTKWSPDLSYGSPRDTIIKRRREAAIRALSDVGTTRTWTLLVDIVAQTGRITAASSPGFIVEGEQRCWLHLVIDRSTGKVVTQFSEFVYE